MLAKLYHRYKTRAVDREIARLKALEPLDVQDLARDRWPSSLNDPLGFYLKCFRFFHSGIPAELRVHREYFTHEGRGFGEDAFHAMWFLLLREFSIGSFLEIGVYRGQVLSLISMLQRMHGMPEAVTGISPFRPLGDTVSKYPTGIDYLEDTLANFRTFSLSQPTLLRHCSTDKEAVELICSRPWDCIYIDGSHDYEVARLDWDNSAGAVKPGGLIVLDDAGLSTAFAPPPFSSKGHPGPSRIAVELDRNRFQEILQVGHNRVFQKLA